VVFMLRKMVENEKKRKKEMLAEEKLKIIKAEEIRKTLKSKAPIDITETHRMMTTDYKGHPMLVWQGDPEQLPHIMLKTGVRLKKKKKEFHDKSKSPKGSKTQRVEITK
jgi:hypothetical protein